MTFSSVLFLLALLQSPPSSDASATLRGLVLDPSGAAVATARVVLASGPQGVAASGIQGVAASGLQGVGISGANASGTRLTRTDAGGRFELSSLPAGTYTVLVEAPGFEKARADVMLAADGERSVTITLEIAALEASVTVGVERLGSREPLEPRLPGSYEIVDRAELDRSHAPSVNEALRKISGVVARDEEGFGLRPNIGLRGLNPTRSSKVLLLEDGIPLTFAPYGDNASYYHPPIERFESIEVLKGSGQVAYGPSTIGGVINYLTPMPPAHPSGTAMFSAGNRSFFDAVATYGSSRGSLGFFVDAMRKQGDAARKNTHSALSDFSGKLVASPSAAQVVTAKGNYYRERSQVGYSGLRQDEYVRDPRGNPFENDAFRGDRVGGSLSHHIAVGSRFTLASSGYVSRFVRHWWRQSSNSAQRPNDSADPACGGMANLLTTCGNEGRLRRYVSGGLESRARLRWGRAGDSDFGARMHAELQDRRQENGDTPTARSGVLVESNERRARAVSGFVQHRFAWKNAAFTPGVRVEHLMFERTNRLANAGRGVSGETTVTEVIPGLGASVRLHERAVFFAGIHRGFAPPRVEDVISNTGGLVDLNAELSWNSEVGVRSRVGSTGRLDATVFRMAYSNQIVPASLAGGAGAVLTNGGRTLHQGFEVSGRVDAAPDQGWLRGFYGRGSYTYLPNAAFTGTRFSAIKGFESVSVSGNRLPYAPRHFGSASVGYAYSTRVDGFVELVSTSRQFGDDLNTIPGTADGQRGLIPSTATWNAGLNVRLPGRVTLFATIHNAADRTYIADRTRGIVPGPPRRLQAGLKVHF